MNRQTSPNTDKKNGTGRFEVTALNLKQTGNFGIVKQDSRNADKKLANVSFILRAEKDVEITDKSNKYYGKINSTYKYVKIKTSANGSWEKEVTGEVKICDIDFVKNINDATRFTTDENGRIAIYNLLLSTNGVDHIKYHLEEVKNENYGYLADEKDYNNFRVTLIFSY